MLAGGTVVGLTVLILSCALYKNWWPMMQLVPFFGLPFAVVLIGMDDEHTTNFSANAGYFLAGVFGVSLFAVPVVLLQLATITTASAVLCILGNLIIFGSVWAFGALVDDDGF